MDFLTAKSIMPAAQNATQSPQEACGEPIVVRDDPEVIPSTKTPWAPSSVRLKRQCKNYTAGNTFLGAIFLALFPLLRGRRHRDPTANPDPNPPDLDQVPLSNHPVCRIGDA